MVLTLDAYITVIKKRELPLWATYDEYNIVTLLSSRWFLIYRPAHAVGRPAWSSSFANCTGKYMLFLRGRPQWRQCCGMLWSSRHRESFPHSTRAYVDGSLVASLLILAAPRCRPRCRRRSLLQRGLQRGAPWWPDLDLLAPPISTRVPSLIIIELMYAGDGGAGRCAAVYIV